MVEQVGSLNTGVKYKDTPIGKIPVDWEVVKLSKTSEINMGQSPPSTDCNEEGDGLPFYQGNAEFGPKHPSPQKWCNRPKKIADEGDILISVRAPVGEINIAPHKCCIGRGIAAVKAKDVDAGFLYQSVLWRRKALQKIAQGSTSQAINHKGFSEMLILLPPSPEQKKIAEILTTLDDAIEKTAQIIEKTKELKKGLLQRPVNKQKKAGEVLNPVDDDIKKESNHKERLKSLKKGLMQVLLTGKLRLKAKFLISSS
jgi:type I restriction enzyme S subunit